VLLLVATAPARWPGSVDSMAVRAAAALAAVLVIAAALVALTHGQSGDDAAPDVGRLNIVFVLADDLRTNDLRYMPNVRRLARDGTSFPNLIVTDSRCCPSRASILTGRYPHNTKVYANAKGNGVFVSHGNDKETFAVALERTGYRTALFGKYLNDYGAGDFASRKGGGVPPGWTDWAASSNAYRGFEYTLNVDGTLRQYGSEPKDYVTDVLRGLGADLIDEAHDDGRPFFLGVSTFTPHLPAVPAPRHANLRPNLRAPRGPSFNVAVKHPPRWLAKVNRIGRREKRALDRRQRFRVRSLASIDEMVGALRKRLEQRDLTGSTVFVFGSDNGFHLGEHQQSYGKFTAFDADIRVPLIAAGPGVAAGRTVDALAQGTDLAPTFIDIAGAEAVVPPDGRSLWPLMRGEPVPADWRTDALVEHLQARSPAKPDQQRKQTGSPPSYRSLRTADTTYVEYRTGEREFYDRSTDPHELHNTYDDLSATQRRGLHMRLRRLAGCTGADECTAKSP
jgi:N-acetylglucosamine-6-sulfatase